MATIETNKSIPETLADLRSLFDRYGIEDWEPIPGRSDHSYSVRYLQSGQWITISSVIQPSKAHNLRQCFQVIQYLFLWSKRGVGGVSQGVTFIHGGLVTTEGNHSQDLLAEAYATIGVESNVTTEEITSVFRAKLKFAHPDKTQDPNEKKIRHERMKRLNVAYELIESLRGSK